MIEYIYHYFSKGGPVMLPIYLCGFIGWCFIFFISAYLRRQKTGALIPVEETMSRFLEEDRAYIRETVRLRKSIVITFIYFLYKSRRRPREVVALQAKALMMDGFLNYYEHLSTLRAVSYISPLLGLLGTVSGMIATFDTISFYGNTNPVYMADGISEAMITTQAGLLVAFPLIFMHTIIKNRLDHIRDRLNLCHSTFMRIEHGEETTLLAN